MAQKQPGHSQQQKCSHHRQYRKFSAKYKLRYAPKHKSKLSRRRLHRIIRRIHQVRNTEHAKHPQNPENPKCLLLIPHQQDSTKGSQCRKHKADRDSELQQHPRQIKFFFYCRSGPRMDAYTACSPCDTRSRIPKYTKKPATHAI